MALPSSPAQAPADPWAHWITPKEQLKKFYSDIAKRVDRPNRLVKNLADIVAQYVCVIDQPFTNWHTALSRLNTLPETIPPLPDDIYEILNSKCPIYGDQKQADGTFHRVKDTHFLALIPEEFGSLSRLEGEILRPFGERQYPGEENPLQFRYFLDEARQEHANVAFPQTHWVLMTKDVLPGSRNKPWNEQVALVDALSRKTFPHHYEIPTLQESFAAITTHMVATGERLYQAGDEQNGNLYTYTRVQEVTRNWHLMVGGFAPSGVVVYYDSHSHSRYGCDAEDIGVAALRKF